MEPETSKHLENNKKMKYKETRNWLYLPKDVMIHIFLKLSVIDLLNNAQFVCSSWHKLSKELQLFQCIDMRTEHGVGYCFKRVTSIALEAIHRSCGQLVEFSISQCGSDEILERIVNNSNSLRRLRLAYCRDVSGDVFIDVVRKLPVLEELELCHCSFLTRVIKAVGCSCPLLKDFRLNHKGVMLSTFVFFEDFNYEALTIAAHMPQLRRLHLFGNTMNEDGLKAILEKMSPP